MIKVVASEQVKRFLAAEERYLRKHSIRAARRLSVRMREASRTLSEFPLVGAARVLPVPGLRRLVVEDYVLDYEVVEDEVRILNMRHGRQRDPYLDYDEDADYEG